MQVIITRRLLTLSEQSPFFSNYGLKGISSISNINNNVYDNLSNILAEKMIGKALFCWMLATVYNSTTESERHALFDYSKDHNLA